MSLTRRELLAGTAWTALGLGSRRASAAPARPNILWLVSEDNNPLLGCYGDALARTPTLDRLARDGVLYEHCYAEPVCAPSRFTLFTGLYAASCGPAQHMRAHGKVPAGLNGFPAQLRAAGYYTTNNAKTDYNAPFDLRAAWDANGRQAHWRNRAAGQPFFAVFNHEVTHESCLFPEQEQPLPFAATDPAQVRIPPYQPDTPEMRADWARFYNHMGLLDRQLAAKLQELAEAGLADDTIVFYYGDNGGILPRSKRFLQRSGIHVPLVVYYPPIWRHLAPAAPGSRLDDVVGFVDFAPTVLSLAGLPVPATLHGQAFAGPARVTTRRVAFCTRDRMDERYDMMRCVTDGHWLYIRNYRPDLPYVQHLEYQFQARGYQSYERVAAAGRLTAATAMFWGTKPTDELYDLEADPDCVRNLATAAAHAAVRATLQAALAERVLAVNDNGFLPEGSALEGYAASRAPGAYPLERVFALANLASERNPAQLPALQAALADPCEPLRWWAAQGCTMLAAAAAPALAGLQRLLADPSVAVAVAAAEALARQGHAGLALPLLERAVQDQEAPWPAVQAANVLDRLGEAARPSLPVMRQVLRLADAADETRNYPQRILRRAVAVLDGRQPALVYPPPG